MIGENSDIFLAYGGALVYLAEPMHKKYSTRFVWGHPLSIHLMTDFSTPSLLYTYVHICSNPPFSYKISSISLIPSSPSLALFFCHSFLILFYHRNSRIDVFVSDTQYFLASHSFSGSLLGRPFR